MPKLNEKQKKIINIVITTLQVLLIIVAITVSAIVIANPKDSVSGGSVKLLPVLTDSMAGNEKDSFKKGDLVIAGNPKDANDLKKGDIVTFKDNINGKEQLNTHRIVNVIKGEDGVSRYMTKGDNNPKNDGEYILSSEVLAVYKFHLSGVGAAISWLQEPMNFGLVILMPLALLMIYNIVLFIRMIFLSKISKIEAEAAGAGEAAIDEEEIKRKAIEEYLAKQKAEQEKKIEDTDDKKID